jgi:Ni,Fe-hydrogenase III small subunit
VSGRERLRRPLRRSLQLRHVDAGSCNGCEAEIGAITNPVYDAQRWGLDVVASPRHADVLTVSGPVTRQMATALRRTHAAMPQPALVVAIGDCALGRCPFRGAYATGDGVGSVLPVDAEVPGCPPAPGAIVARLRALMAAPQVRPRPPRGDRADDGAAGETG